MLCAQFIHAVALTLVAVKRFSISSRNDFIIRNESFSIHI